MSINKETLKRTWLYIHCRKLFLWPIDFYRWYPKQMVINGLSEKLHDRSM